MRCPILFLFFVVLNLNLFAEEKYSIGLMADFSGKIQEQGDKCRDGYELAVSTLDPQLKKQIQFVYEDQGSSAKNAITAFQKVMKAKNLLGAIHFGSHTAIATNPLSLKNKIPVVGLSAHPDFIKSNKYAFSSWLEASREAGMYLGWILKNKYKRVAIVTTEHDYTLALRDSFIEEGKKNGIELTLDEIISEDSDFRSLIPKLINADTEAIFINLLPPNFSIFLKQLGQLGYKGAKLSVNTNGEDEYVQAAGVNASNDTIFYGPDYRKKFYANLTDQQHPYSYTCYLGLKFMLEALKVVIEDGKVSREALYEQMSKMKEVSIEEERILVAERRLIYDFAMKKAEGGKVFFVN